MQVTSHQAQAIIDGAATKALELGLPVIVAVLDAGAHLKAFRRMDGAVLASIDIAIAKARTAVLFQANSEAVWEYCKPGAPAPALELTNGGLAPFGGGIPIRSRDGNVIGALGVSGGTVAQDMEVAQAALASFANLSG
ncbi:MAG: GlcG/HbpS family heme-binding protein [Pseudomonadota bacterium]